MSKEKLNAILENGYEVKIGDYFSEGFQVYKKNIGGFTGITFLMLLIYIVFIALSQVPILGMFASLLFSIGIYLLMAGFMIVIKKVKYDEPYEFRDFFAGFKGDVVGPLLAINIISGIMLMIGFLLCIIPGIYLSVAYIFGVYIMLFFKMDFWESLEFSRKIVSKKWFSFFGLMFLMTLLNMLGFVFLLVGAFVTIPWTLCTMYVCFDDIFSPGSDTFENKIDSFGSHQRDINTEADERTY